MQISHQKHNSILAQDNRNGDQVAANLAARETQMEPEWITSLGFFLLDCTSLCWTRKNKKAIQLGATKIDLSNDEKQTFRARHPSKSRKLTTSLLKTRLVAIGTPIFNRLGGGLCPVQ